MPFNRFDHSILGEIRPRFQLKINLDAEEALNHVEKSIPKDATVAGEKSINYVFLRIPKHYQHYWSPELSVRIEKEEYTEYTTVFCLVGPKQSVWAMFALLYAFIFFASTFAGIYGIVKFQNSGDTLWLWTIPVGVLLTFSIFFTSKLGQKKGRDQMLHLISFLYHSLDEVATVERIVDK